MTLPANALTTLATINDELGLTSDGGAVDDRIERYIAVYSDLFAHLCDRKLHYVAGYAERVGSPGADRLIVHDHCPVVSVASITLSTDPTGADYTTIDADTYEIEDADAGFIRSSGGWTSTQVWSRGPAGMYPATTPRALYTVTYTGGYITPQQAADGAGTRSLPYDIEDAVIAAVVARYRAQGVDQTVQKLGMMDGSIEYVRGQRVPAQFVEVAASHRRYRV